jgi:plasmid stabilization system protein ParE
MTYRVIVTRRAERDVHDAAEWWATNRSPEQANRWQ